MIFHTRILLLLLAISAATQLYAQDFNHYKPLEGTGEIPQDFLTLTRIKYQKDVEEQKNKSAKKNINAKTDHFILETNYLVDELLLSGKVLFNDPVSSYISKVADVVLANDPALREKLRFYVVKSNEANAFSTRQGIIFITLGLMSQLENEAQLAFVIAHETAHYMREHVINSWMESNRIFSERSSSYKYNDYEEKIKLASTYSKNLELEADSIGARMLLKTKYQVREAINSLDVIQYSELPFDDQVFSAGFLEAPDMKMPKSFFLEKVKEVDFSKENEDDKYSSHPNMATRRNVMTEALHKVKTGGNEKFIVSSQEFENVRKISRFECIRLLQLNRQYPEAIYSAQQLLNYDSTNRYLKISIGKSLYGIAKYKFAGDYSKCGEYYSSVEGNYQQCAHVFYQMSDKQAMVITARYLYDLYKQYPEPFIEKIRDDIFIDLYENYQISVASFEKVPEPEFDSLVIDSSHVPDSLNTGNEQNNNSSTENLSKYDKLRKERKELAVSVTTDVEASKSEFYVFAFSDYLDNPEFTTYFEKMTQKAKDNKQKAEKKKAIEAKMSYYDKRTRTKREEQERKSKGVKLGIQKLVFVDPFYIAMDTRKKLKMENSEMKLVDFSHDLEQVSQLSGLNAHLLAPKLFSSTDVDKFNQMSQLNDWMGERLDHENKEMIPLESENMENIANTFGTNYFAYTGVVNFKKKKENVGAILLAGIVLYPTLPFVIGWLVTPNHYTLYYTIMFDVTSGECYLNENIVFKSKDSRGTLQSMMYDLMLQIKKE